MKNHLHYLVVLAFLICIGACQTDIPDAVQNEMDSLPESIDYNFHVKPILSDRCYACHGPDEQKRGANLRLDIEASAYEALESGAGRAIVAKSIHRSQLVNRILEEDPELQMPPPESKLTLNHQEKAILIKWIEQGAEYKTHWAFAKPEKAAIPKIENNNRAKNEIDHFIFNQLQQKDIQPAPEAKREQLIRRLYFDLTGLPPSLKDLDHWMTEPADDYYEKLVDQLLASSAYGERMTAHWIDVSRFADSEGYLDDFHHTFWPYRDWVIESFNRNQPYDEFVLWQVGGDQIPDASQNQILATAFNRNHKQNSEGGVTSEEFRVEYVADRTNTVGTAFMGLTVGCARCHDHKYDPISQENYYQLFSFFNSTNERGDGIFSNNSIEYGQMVPNKLSMNSGPVLALPSKEVKEIHDFLLKRIEDKQSTIQQLANNNLTAFAKWNDQQKNTNALVKAIDDATVSHITFDDMADGTAKDLAKANKIKPSYWGSVNTTEGVKGKALRSDAHGQFKSDGTTSSFERNEPFTISFWMNTPKAFQDAHIIYNGNNRIQGFRGWDVMLDSLTPHFRLNHAHPFQSLDIYPAEHLVADEWTHFVWTYDGSGDAKGMKLYRNGAPAKIKIARNYLYRSTEPYTSLEGGTVYMAYGGIVIGNRHYDQDWTDGKIDELRILNKEADPIIAQYLFDPQKGESAFMAALNNNQLDQFYDLFIDQKIEAEKVALREIQFKEIETIDTVQEIMVMGDQDRERPTFILDRGVYDAYGQPVERKVPEEIMAWPEDLPRNRYGLGQWLIHEDHPLTTRVAVNQFWYLMFGKGIVRTVEDFGNQGALPTHPELLDWLAVDFRQNDWNVKRLIKQMVMSATYRQSSKIRSELQEIDPDNNMLARGPRYRRSAEMIRDNVLAASGLLNDEIGGPSVFPYQPDGLWKEVMTHTFFPEYQVDYENGLYRRSIYTFWKRNMPPPSMLIFDAAYRGECQVRRLRSNTPLQALVLLNDPQMIEGCRVLAEKMWRYTKANVTDATTNAFRLLTSREPTNREKEILQKQFQDELKYFQAEKNKAVAYMNTGAYKRSKDLPVEEVAALARVTNTILNSTEAYYKN